MVLMKSVCASLTVFRYTFASMKNGLRITGAEQYQSARPKAVPLVLRCRTKKRQSSDRKWCPSGSTPPSRQVVAQGLADPGEENPMKMEGGEMCHAG
jgi:hypothetical protein